jgi:hypothetical protein
MQEEVVRVWGVGDKEKIKGQSNPRPPGIC